MKTGGRLSANRFHSSLPRYRYTRTGQEKEEHEPLSAGEACNPFQHVARTLFFDFRSHVFFLFVFSFFSRQGQK
jgi:hypothetical protein